MGFVIEDKRKILAWWKYLCFRHGISPREFKKCLMKDIKEIMYIERQISSKELREAELQKMISNMKW